MKKAGSLFGILALIALLFTACARQGTSTATGQGGSYHSALKTNYQDALNVEGQLALGTLELEDTPNQVTQDEAVALLSPWEALQANAAKSTVEQQALLAQIERTMSGAQITAIAALRLTQADARTWLQGQEANSAAGRGAAQQGGGGQGPSSEGAATRRAQFQNASPEQRATLAARFGSGQRGTTGTNARSGTQFGSATGQTFTFPLQPVVALLMARSGQGAAQPAPVATAVAPTRRPVQTTETPEASTPTPAPTPTGTPTQAVAPAPDQALVATNTPLPTPTSTLSPPISTSAPVSALVPAAAPLPDPPGTPAPAAASLPALVRIKDTNPGPPFTVQISANRATQDPLVAESDTYLVTGLVRNDGDRTFAVNRINVTFYDANGFRGYFRRFPNLRSGGEWIWFGATQAEFACLLLAPGEACPFSVEITAQDIASFLVHPDAAPTERESAPVTPNGLNVTRDPPGYVRITGTVANPNSFEVKNAIVCGVLLDDGGQIVSLGSSYVLQENIGPGATVQFDLRVPYNPYADYQLYAQAERDWN